MTSKKYLCVANPFSGVTRKKELLEQLQSWFAMEQAELDVHFTESAGHAIQLGQHLDISDYQGLCVLGGDGTVREFIDGLMHRPSPPTVPLGVLPGGTGNSLHKTIGSDKLRDAAERILRGQQKPLDLMRVTTGDKTIHCINLVGWGAIAQIALLAEKLRWMGRPRYAAASLYEIGFARRSPVKLVLDGQEDEDDFLLIIGCNTKYVGSSMKMAPHAELDDGKVDLVIVRQATAWQMIRLFHKVFDGSHVDLPFVEYHQVQSFQLETINHNPLNLDGDVTATSPVQVETVSEALQVFV